MKNCPNCGAPVSGSHCEYCGTDFEPVYVKLDNYIPLDLGTGKERRSFRMAAARLLRKSKKS